MEPAREKAQRVYNLFDEGKLDEARTLTLEVESLCNAVEDENEQAACVMYAGMCLVDIGQAVKERDMVQRGIGFFDKFAEKHVPQNERARAYYNLANGYFALWRFDGDQCLTSVIDSQEHQRARHFYRNSIQKLQPPHFSDGFACEVWTNYGNLLDSAGRAVEAISAYDTALRINPNMGMALGNKGIAISHLAPLMYGYTHRFYLEALRLLENALTKQLTPDAKTSFARKLTQLNSLLEKHGEMIPEEIQGIVPKTDFHRYLCAVCARYNLFLSPASFLGNNGDVFYGDPMFISTMYAGLEDKSKFDRYISFLNEIKQDYVLGRYLLVQSQYETVDIDAMDEGVSLFYPLDYSLQSIYIQLLKAANKQAIAVLDKVAYFIYDYCGLKSPGPRQVSFLKLFGDGDQIRDDLRQFANPHLLALFSISKDLSRQGDWKSIQEHRNALTHRFLVIHDELFHGQIDKNIPRVYLEDFLNTAVLALQTARVAVMYLILFVEHTERGKGNKKTGLTAPIFGTPIDDLFRYRPSRYTYLY